MFRPKCFARPHPISCVNPLPEFVKPMPEFATTLPTMLQRPVISVGGECQITQGPAEIVVEPVLVAPPNVFHHHKCVQHIQPVMTQDIHHYHSHHKYAVEEEKKCEEVVTHNHGLCGQPIVQPANVCQPMEPECGCF